MKETSLNLKKSNPYLLSRRHFIVTSGAAVASTLILPNWGRAILSSEKRLKLYNLHTGEWFKEIYAISGSYLPESLKKINYFLRDFRTEETTRIDPKLLDLMHDLAQKTEENKAFEIISGYRSPTTNRTLRQQRCGVALNSYHLQGQAIDFRGSKNLRSLRDAARSFKAGGVGYYSSSRFIHIDTRGTVRWW